MTKKKVIWHRSAGRYRQLASEEEQYCATDPPKKLVDTFSVVDGEEEQYCLADSQEELVDTLSRQKVGSVRSVEQQGIAGLTLATFGCGMDVRIYESLQPESFLHRSAPLPWSCRSVFPAPATIGKRRWANGAPH